MLQAMLSGVASIKAQQSRMNVIGDNLANVNTTAFKSSRVSFAEMMSQTVRSASGATASRGGVNPIQYGLGVSVTSTDVNDTQGALNQTNKTTDLAIQGNGYFITSNSQRMAFTRDGSFQVDTQGYLVSSATGERVLGWQGSSAGAIDTTEAMSPTSYVSIPSSLNSVQQTTNATFAGNLNANAVATDTATSSVRIYDSQGGYHDINLVMKNHSVPPAAGGPASATSSWDWEAWEGTPGTGTLVGSSSTGTNEPMFFDSSGAQVSNLASGTFNQITLTPTASQSFAQFSVDMNFSKISQLNGTSQVTATDQDGFAPGALESFSISQDGVVTGIFTNGFTRPIAQVALASFSNPEGLERSGNNLLLESDNSGRPLVGTPRTDGRGTISAGFLEQSNVDISSEFTDLIVTQRGFQANTKVVTTVDELLQDLINMKR
ncbi:MAG: flagellar hook-basal body complex protein [Armatimonadetes bacterium]|nr:flagellar hook-basal body complex protein [Armatimonadota bacterium]